LEQQAGVCRFHHAERFSGILLPPVSKGGLFKATRQGFEAMNVALKTRAEAA
jgi:hypothetical protein